MDLHWTDDWQPFEETSPYVHWWERTKPEPQPRESFTFGLAIQKAALRLTGIGTDKGLDTAWLEGNHPVPGFAHNAGFAEHLAAVNNWLPDPDDLPELDADTVIVGVIDTGIALGHNRFRNEDGSSRVLAAWQNTAEWAEKKQPYLPYGRELYRAEIDDQLRDHSGGSLSGWLDEDIFNRATGVLQMTRALGNREVAGRYAHGTHVLDAAAGADPTDPDQREFRRRVKIIAVNLPGSITFGESGTFLDSFMIFAIRRITDLADAMWFKNNPDTTAAADAQGGRKGYPVVINLSFGKQAGSKSALDVFAASLKDFHEERENRKRMPVRFTMPIGNDNLARCNAYLKPGQGRGGLTEVETLNWRIAPEDQSANYVELWSDNFSHSKQYASGDLAAPLELALVPPGGQPSFVAARPKHWRPLLCRHPDGTETPVGGLYFEVLEDEINKGVCRFRYLLAVGPTLAQTEGVEAPAGLWRIMLRSQTPKKSLWIASIQTDQAILPGRTIGMRSYFDDPDYRVFDIHGEIDGLEAGRPVPSYEYPGRLGQFPRNLDLVGGSRVRRHGTMNASAAHKAVARVAGYRVSDGRPASYSATGRGRWDGSDDGTGMCQPRDPDRKRAPTASLPTDDGPAHFGILGAGAANGSVVPMRGTSFAAPQAARCIVDELLAGSNVGLTGSALLFRVAKGTGVGRSRAISYEGKTDIETHGGGRIESPLTARVSRTGRT